MSCRHQTQASTMELCAASSPAAADSDHGQATVGRTTFTMRDLQHLLLLEFDTAAAKKLQWSMSPLEYLARRCHQKFLVHSVPVAALLPHIPAAVSHCRQLLADTTTAQARAAARPAFAFISRVLAVLKVRRVQQKLGGSRHLRPSITLLEQALQEFSRSLSRQQNSTTPIIHPTDVASAARAAATAAAAPAAVPGPCAPPAPQHTKATALAAAGVRQAQGDWAVQQPASSDTAGSASTTYQQHSGTSSSSTKGLDLAALLAALAPFVARPDSPFPPGFPQLLATWARLVYGELSDISSIQVAALVSCHWRTLLRYLDCCMQEAVAPSTGCMQEAVAPSTGCMQEAVAPSTGCMPLDTAVSHVDALLHLLQYDSLQALFTQEGYARVTDRYSTLKALLHGCAAQAASAATATGGAAQEAPAALTQPGSALTGAQHSASSAATSSAAAGWHAGAAAALRRAELAVGSPQPWLSPPPRPPQQQQQQQQQVLSRAQAQLQQQHVLLGTKPQDVRLTALLPT